ncbi:Rec8 like protein-domain-containing protein [Pyrenochaeta sp. MPI-SDFR-AT-0127]|nr:Rec8 like protein-domain-containing protein [Pyrenochaeta sp. MPI-SDFR-AT-0127]
MLTFTVLTSRKYGVATVWLVATLGAKSSLKRINRKQIFEVDVEKACQTISNPVAPLALRLQGNLLYGVSRVYLQQCGYVLSDAQSAENTMRMLLRTVKSTALDPDAGKSRPEQLVLPDDPTFLPDFTLPPPDILAELDPVANLDITHFDESQTLSPFGSQQSQSSHAASIGGLILPTSSPTLTGVFRVDGNSALHSIGRSSGIMDAGDMLEVIEPGFTFDDDGDIIDLSPGNELPKTPGMHGRMTMPYDADASARVRREHEEGKRAGAQFPDGQVDIDFPIYGDDAQDGEAFPSVDQKHSNEQAGSVESSSIVAAPIRRKPRAAHVLPHDTHTELRNKDLADWNINYIENMKNAIRLKNQARVSQQAKKKAEYFVWGSGIGGIASQMPNNRKPHPFDMFIGDNLFELVTGMSRKKVTRSKHDRDSGIDDATQEEHRRVRQKTGAFDEAIGRGFEDEGFFMRGGDEIELPREGAIALDDQQIFSAMPWNISASIRGSSAIPRSGRVGMIGSIDQSKRGSRLVSASPLLGRGRPDELEALRVLESDADFDFGGDEFAIPEPSSNLPESAVPPHTSTRVQEALSAEGENFLTFVSEAIVEKRNLAQADLELMSDYSQAEAAANINEVTFEELLPPHENITMVACQGLMMLLALGTKGMLDVHQPEHFGEIGIKLTEQAKAMQVIEISDGEDFKEEEDSDEIPVPMEEGAVDPNAQDDLIREELVSNEDESHFEDRFAAGTAAGETSDHDSLYDD